MPESIRQFQVETRHPEAYHPDSREFHYLFGPHATRQEAQQDVDRYLSRSLRSFPREARITEWVRVDPPAPATTPLPEPYRSDLEVAEAHLSTALELVQHALTTPSAPDPGAPKTAVEQLQVVLCHLTALLQELQPDAFTRAKVYDAARALVEEFDLDPTDLRF